MALPTSAVNWEKVIRVLRKFSPVPLMDLQSDPGALLFDASDAYRDLFRGSRESTLLHKFILLDS
jgi:hypothetical protein